MAVVTASGRRYQRRFDWEQARVRYQAGETMTAIAASYGVSREAVRRVVDAAYYAREQIRLAVRQKTGRCVDCGRQINPTSTRCIDCAAVARRTAVRPDTLHCSACDQWKPDSAFYHDARSRARRYRRWQCKTCDNQARRRHRQRPEPAFASPENDGLALACPFQIDMNPIHMLPKVRRGTVQTNTHCRPLPRRTHVPGAPSTGGGPAPAFRSGWQAIRSFRLQGGGSRIARAEPEASGVVFHAVICDRSACRPDIALTRPGRP